MPSAPPAANPFGLTPTGSGGPPQDMAEVRRALAVLADPARGVQLQAAPGWGHNRVTAKGDELDLLCAWVEERRSAVGVYYALNPVPPDLDHAILNADALCRRWLLVDVDRSKEAAPHESSTDAEKDAARGVAASVVDWLAGRGWPAPVLVDSGNGFHLLYRLDLPNDALSKSLIAAFLKALAKRFDGGGGKVGKECHDARRVAKLPGTWARRGGQSDDRPHRLARLLRVPPALEAVPADLIRQTTQALGEPQPAATPAGPDTPFVLTAATGSDRTYARAVLEGECSLMALAQPGGLNEQLFRCGAACGNFVPHLLNEEEVFESLLSAARSAGANNPAKDADTLRRAIALGKTKPRLPPDRNGRHGPAPDPPDGVIIYRASSVTPKKVKWLWQGRIPLGKLTTFAGVGGLGKTFVLCDITARVTRGSDWPDSAGECCEPGQVLFVSGEDDADDTLVPRLIELGADLDRVAFLKTETLNQFTLADLKTLDKAIDQIGQSGPPVRFVAIDPPTAYLGGLDDHKNSELRGLLSPLASWASERRVAVVFNTHINKGSGQKVDAMMRVMGSVAWVFAVRAAHLFARDPDDPERRLFVGMKMNIGKERKGLAYKIASTSNDLARVEWLGEVDTTANEAINSQSRQNRAVQATDFIRQMFTDRREIPSEEIWASTRAAGLSVNAVKEAKAKMRIRAVRRGLPDEHQLWYWIWPDGPLPTGPEPTNPKPDQGAEEVQI